MILKIQSIWQRLFNSKVSEPDREAATIPDDPQRAITLDLDIAPDDPLLKYFANAPDAVEIDKIFLDSDALRALKDAGVKLVVPLVSQGELIALLNLGPRLSEQDYSADDRRLLNTLSTQAAPALRVAQLVRQQQVEARERERIEQELRVARVIQQTLLPKELPDLENWQLAAHWQPARAVSGDFYDFINFPDGRLGIVIGDVTDKGVPAAMVMATTRSVLRATAERYQSPGQVLERTNDLLVPDIPHNMFVTCMYIVLDPVSGEIVYANAGHNLPYKNCSEGICELRATGMPLGLMPGMAYEEKQDAIGDGECVLLYSDGLVEAHNPQGDMFGNPRLERLLTENPGGEPSIRLLLDELAEFTGEDWEQEDDVTFVSIERFVPESGEHEDKLLDDTVTLAEFTLPSQRGNERQAMENVAQEVQGAGLLSDRVDQLKTAVAEATMNAMEHGNLYNPDIQVEIKVTASEDELNVFITDRGVDHPMPEKVTPDLEAKLAGEQSPRGWGLFLIENMVDSMEIEADENHHTIRLIYRLKEQSDDDTNV